MGMFRQSLTFLGQFPVCVPLLVTEVTVSPQRVKLIQRGSSAWLYEDCSSAKTQMTSPTTIKSLTEEIS
jgi:hypothetical protein